MDTNMEGRTMIPPSSDPPAACVRCGVPLYMLSEPCCPPPPAHPPPVGPAVVSCQLRHPAAAAALGCRSSALSGRHRRPCPLCSVSSVLDIGVSAIELPTAHAWRCAASAASSQSLLHRRGSGLPWGAFCYLLGLPIALCGHPGCRGGALAAAGHGFMVLLPIFIFSTLT
jgi:hypothetical protein